MRYFTIDPEVAGGWGPHTIAITSVHPPIVSHLHYEFDGWLGDDIVQTFPCLLVSKRLIDLFAVSWTGYELAAAETSKSDEFNQLYPELVLPPFSWLKVTGVAGQHDFGLTKDFRFVVSESVVDVLKQVTISNCVIDEWNRDHP